MNSTNQQMDIDITSQVRQGSIIDDQIDDQHKLVVSLKGFDDAMTTSFARMLKSDEIKNIVISQQVKYAFSETGIQKLSITDGTFGLAGATALAEALKNDKHIVSVDFSGNQIGDKGAEVLANAFLSNHKNGKRICGITLMNNNIGDAGAEALAEVLKGNPYIYKIHLEGNDIGTLGIYAITDALIANNRYPFSRQSEIHVGLDENNFDIDGINDLIEAEKSDNGITISPKDKKTILEKLKTKLTRIEKIVRRNLKNCFGEFSETRSINDEYIITVARVLQTMKMRPRFVITSFQISNNDMGEEALSAIVEMLKINKNITSLNLDNNNLGNKVSILAEALKTIKHIEKLSLASNAISDKGASDLADAFIFNNNISVDINNNYIGTEVSNRLEEILGNRLFLGYQFSLQQQQLQKQQLQQLRKQKEQLRQLGKRKRTRQDPNYGQHRWNMHVDNSKPKLSDYNVSQQEKIRNRKAIQQMTIRNLFDDPTKNIKNPEKYEPDIFNPDKNEYIKSLIERRFPNLTVEEKKDILKNNIDEMNTEKAYHFKSDGETKKRRVILEESTSIYHDVRQPDPRVLQRLITPPKKSQQQIRQNEVIFHYNFLKKLVKALFKKDKESELEKALEIINLLYQGTKSQTDINKMKQQIKKKALQNIQNKDIFSDMPNDQLKQAINEYKAVKDGTRLDALTKREIKNLVVAKDNPEMDLDKNTLNVTTGSISKKGTYNDKLDKNDFFKSKQQVQIELKQQSDKDKKYNLKKILNRFQEHQRTKNLKTIVELNKKIREKIKDLKDKSINYLRYTNNKNIFNQEDPLIKKFKQIDQMKNKVKQLRSQINRQQVRSKINRQQDHYINDTMDIQT